jgi:hypothetical protein
LHKKHKKHHKYRHFKLAVDNTLLALPLCHLAVCVAGYAGASCSACAKGAYSVGETAKNASVSCSLCSEGKTTEGTNSTSNNDCNSKSTVPRKCWYGPQHTVSTMLTVQEPINTC